MNYKEKYNEILEWARKNKARLNGVPIEEVLPELRESEDERITRAINNMLPFIPDEAYANNGVTKEGVLNWLEKQKEQKPEWSEEDETYLQDALWCVKQAYKLCKTENDTGSCWSAEKWLKSLKLRIQ